MLKEKVIIYGLGQYYQRNEDFLHNNFNVVGFADKYKQGEYNGNPIITPDMLLQFPDTMIMIMVENIQIILEIAVFLNDELGVESDRIIVGMDVIPEGDAKKRGLKSIKYIGDGLISVQIRDFECNISSLDEFNNVMEVLGDGVYDYWLNSSSMDIVFDVGMNIGDAALFFANMERVEKVYAFEPFTDTYLMGKKNIEKNVNINSDKILTYNFGLSNVTEKRQISYNAGMSCGMSTIQDITNEAGEHYEKMGLIDNKDTCIDTIEVKRASEIIDSIISQNPDRSLVLKMDCEGEEYGIIQDLSDSGILGKFNLIMLEWHYKGKEELLGFLKKNNFSWHQYSENRDTGLIYAFKRG